MPQRLRFGRSLADIVRSTNLLTYLNGVFIGGVIKALVK